MYKQFREKSNRSVYLPNVLIDAIEKQAANEYLSFNRVIVEVLLKQFRDNIGQVSLDQGK